MANEVASLVHPQHVGVVEADDSLDLGSRMNSFSSKSLRTQSVKRLLVLRPHKLTTAWDSAGRAAVRGWGLRDR